MYASYSYKVLGTIWLIIFSVHVLPHIILQARGKLSTALDMILKKGLPQVDASIRKQLVSQGYITKFSAAGDMAFVRGMPRQQAVTHLLTKVQKKWAYTFRSKWDSKTVYM